jgi:SH3 domain-containing protein/PEGA domain-containing protein
MKYRYFAMRRPQNKESLLKTLSTILIVILLSGCAIPTVIKSKPEGATVYIDNIKMGNTPLTYSDKAILWSQKPIRIEMNGYKPLNTAIKKDQLKIGPLVWGCFVGVPLLWALGYAEEYTFELDRGHAPTSATTGSTSENPQKLIKEKPVAAPVSQPSEKATELKATSSDTTSASKSMVVTSSKAKIRKKPSTKAAIVKNLKKGEKVQVIKQQDEWFQIELAGGDVGWCHKSVLTQSN